MSNDSPTNLPTHFRNGLLALEPFIAAHPGLAEGIETIQVNDEGGVTATWSRSGRTFAQLQAVAMAHQDLKWKRQRHLSDFTWYAIEGPVTVVLPHCEAVELDFGPSLIDFSTFKISGATLAPA